MSFQISPETLLIEVILKIEQTETELMKAEENVIRTKEIVDNLSNDTDPFTRTRITQNFRSALGNVIDTKEKLSNLFIQQRIFENEVEVRKGTPPTDDQLILIPAVPPVLEQTKVFGLSLKQLAVLIGVGVLIL